MCMLAQQTAEREQKKREKILKRMKDWPKKETKEKLGNKMQLKPNSPRSYDEDDATDDTGM